ncbi:hypothetical protein GW924_00340 [Candidatus Pacearchaeota archaeon]|nr:hypothetical protein [Candidatus Pacearchaeota archaeon]
MSIEPPFRVIGIYGVNATGKSTLAHEISRYYPEYDTVATDNPLAIKRMLEPNNPIFQNSSYTQWKRFGEPTPKNIWAGFIQYRESMGDFLDCLLERARDQRVGMIFEGIHIDPRRFFGIRGIDVNLFLLHVSDRKVHEEHTRQKCAYRPELMDRLETNFSYIEEIQRGLLKEAREIGGIGIIETGDSIKEAVSKIREGLS